MEEARRPFRTGAGMEMGGMLHTSPAQVSVRRCATTSTCKQEMALFLVLTGGEVESSQLTALHSRDAFEDMADHLAHTKNEKEA